MTYVTAEARQQLLDDLAGAVDSLARALAALGGAYDALDDDTADRMEEVLFRPVQTAYGRAQRTHAGFARRMGLPGRTFAPAAAPGPTAGARALLDNAMDAVDDADAALSALQDSMMPVEVGDPELRAGLAQVRELVAGVRVSARELIRRLGR